MNNLQKAPGTSTAPVSSALTRPKQANTLMRHTLTLMKPVTWFAPTWAFLCGAVASGGLSWDPIPLGRLALGLIMAGPLLCGLSQVVNDYCDQEVDAINEPHRLIPSGLVSLRHVLIITLVLTWIGCSLALLLGSEVALYVGIGLFFNIAYSMKPFRAKRNGWIGNALVSFSYEGLAWLAGHVAFAPLTFASVLLAFFYSLGAHGIMTVNDFKSIEGDKVMGIRSIPVMYGKKLAARMVVVTMALAQVAVIIALVAWGNPISAAVVGLLLIIQAFPYVRFFQDPERYAVFFNATAIMLFVWGMMAAAIGIAA